MRAKLVEAWPALSRLYGIRPWDVQRLSIAELNSYLDDLDLVARSTVKGG